MENHSGPQNEADKATIMDDSRGAEKSLLDRLKLHPASALLVLALDTALFGGNALSGGLLTFISIGVGFVGSFVGVTLIEKFLGGETNGKSIAKGFLLGILAGIPTSITTTAIGTILLTLAGLKKINSSRILPGNKKSD